MRILVHPLATEVLGSTDFSVVPYGDRYAALGARLKLNFDNILFALHHVPLCLDGPAHAEQRADMARLIGERRPAVTAALPGIVQTSFAVLSEPGPQDLLGRLVLPCVDALICVLAGTDLEFDRDALTSRIFSQSLGVARRKRLEREVADLVARMTATFPGDTPLRLGSRLSLAILGRDALIGTLALSLHDMLVKSTGRPLSETPLDMIPTHTGVPYIDRQARCPADVGGAAVAPGDVVRCMLQSLEGADESARLRFFGAGAHLCLGRAVTLDLFEQIARHLATVQTRVTVTEFALRDDDVFACPETFNITVSP